MNGLGALVILIFVAFICTCGGSASEDAYYIKSLEEEKKDESDPDQRP